MSRFGTSHLKFRAMKASKSNWKWKWDNSALGSFTSSCEEGRNKMRRASYETSKLVIVFPFDDGNSIVCYCAKDNKGKPVVVVVHSYDFGTCFETFVTRWFPIDISWFSSANSIFFTQNFTFKWSSRTTVHVYQLWRLSRGCQRQRFISQSIWINVFISK